MQSERAAGLTGPQAPFVSQNTAYWDYVDSHRPGVTNFAHIGLVVEDLDETVRFLALLGLMT